MRYRNEDWTVAAARWGAFWKGECLDRPPAVVFAWDAEAAKPPDARSLEERYTSAEYLARRTRHDLRYTHHLGDVPAIARLDLGPVCGARLFGGVPEYAAFGFNATSPAHGREIVARLANAYRLSPGGRTR
jgi:hypothetical protein